uniref:non-specific serine/threonine protein kinase n=1 Tax=Ascaris lumbricoides TaxID=6252 RepID=A0A0M3HTE5_ASCLU
MASLAKKMKKLAAFQFFNIKLLLNGRGFSKFKKTYRLKGELGRGGFGVVYRAVRISDETPVAVKFIERRHVRDWGKLNDERVPMEICMLARCTRIRGVIKLLDWYSMPEGFLIVMERPYPCIDLFDFIKSQGTLDEDLARFLFHQVAETVIECARHKVLHRDIKDENVVIDLVSGETRLVDFGAATLLKKTHYTDFQGLLLPLINRLSVHICKIENLLNQSSQNRTGGRGEIVLESGTRLYCPPEWFLHSLYLGEEAAVWSLGVLLYNMLNGQLPFRNEKDICTSHLLGPLPFHASLTDEAKDLLGRCLRFDPFARCSFDELISHPWMLSTTADWLTLTATTNETSNEQLDGSLQGETSESTSEGSRCQSQMESDADSECDSANCSHTSSMYSASSENGGDGLVVADSDAINGETERPVERVVRLAKTSLLEPPNPKQLAVAVIQGTQTRKARLPKTNSMNHCTRPNCSARQLIQRTTKETTDSGRSSGLSSSIVTIIDVLNA